MDLLRYNPWFVHSENVSRIRREIMLSNMFFSSVRDWLYRSSTTSFAPSVNPSFSRVFYEHPPLGLISRDVIHNQLVCVYVLPFVSPWTIRFTLFVCSRAAEATKASQLVSEAMYAVFERDRAATFEAFAYKSAVAGAWDQKLVRDLHTRLSTWRIGAKCERGF